jgi:hypothetical protein
MDDRRIIRVMEIIHGPGNIEGDFSSDHPIEGGVVDFGVLEEGVEVAAWDVLEDHAEGLELDS